MLRPRKARMLALPAVLALGVIGGCAQTPGPVLSQTSDSLPQSPVLAESQVTAQIPSQPLAQAAPQPPSSPEPKTSRKSKKSATPMQQDPAPKAAPAVSAKDLPRDDFRFLKSLPPKPALQPPFPSIATPAIETNPNIPLLTEAQQKKMEEDLTKLGKAHSDPKQPAPKKKVKDKAKTPPEAS